MLYAITRAVATRLAARGCPLPIGYGPEPLADLALTKPRIVIERPRDSLGDTVTAPRAHKHNPQRRAERGADAIARVYAQSTADGARVQDHEAQAEQAADMLIVALQAAVGAMHTTHVVTSCGYVSAVSLALPELRVWPGVVYELRFTVQRGVLDRTWAGEGKPTQSVFSITTSGPCTCTTAPDP